MRTIATTRAGLQSYGAPDIQHHRLPPFSLPGIDLSGATQASPKEGLASIANSQSGFIGKEFALLVTRTLD